MRASTRNRVTFGLGTLGRDMVYSMVSMYAIFYLTDVIDVPTSTMWWINIIILACRVFDALNDPVMGVIVDNTRSRWGKFKPWIALGAVLAAIFTVLLFSNPNGGAAGYAASFGVCYLLWGISYTINDISYWSMLPSLSVDQKERERIGSFSKISANIGMFFVVAGIVPLTAMLGGVDANLPGSGDLALGYRRFAWIVSIAMIAFQCITLLGVREAKIVTKQQPHTSLRDMVRVIGKNDQLLFTAISMSLFMVGYMTTTSFGLYFFKYAYGDEGMYPIFAIVLGVSQITALMVFPLFSKRFTRRTLYTAAIALIAIGYIVFFFAPVTTMLYIGIAGILLFVGQAFVQLLMLMFLADSVDYGHWKLGKRNDSVTFALQPFINKIGGAIASGVVGTVAILSGIKDAKTAADVTSGGILMMKNAMMVFPLICIAASFVIYRWKYRLDEGTFAGILSDLRDRGEIAGEENNGGDGTDIGAGG